MGFFPFVPSKRVMVIVHTAAIVQLHSFEAMDNYSLEDI